MASRAEPQQSHTANARGSEHHSAHHKAFEVITVPVLSDNFARSKEAAVVDPADPVKVAEVIKAKNLTLRAVYTTHHHADHSQGNSEMVQMFPGIKVYGGDNRVIAVTNILAGKAENKVVPKNDENELKLGDLSISVYSVPCHTSGHLLYLVSAGATDNDAVFTGDTVFSGGCGRFFEGTAEQMYYNLCTVAAGFKPSTRVYCGHEYTVKNMKFALSVEADNSDYQQALAESEAAVAKGYPTVPSTIEREKRINIFMRCKEPSVAAALKLSVDDPVAVLAELRKLKDKF